MGNQGQPHLLKGHAEAGPEAKDGEKQQEEPQLVEWGIPSNLYPYL